MQVKEILRVKGNRLLSIEPAGRAADAVATMAKENLGSLVVIDQGRVVGMLTFHELLQAVAKPAASESRKATSSATSCTRPTRPTGCCAWSRFFTGACAIQPGLMQFTRTCGPRLSASACVSATRPPLLAA